MKKDEKFDPKLDYRSAMPQFTPEAADQNRALLELLRDLAERKLATPAQISPAWMLCKKPYTVPIPGSRKVDRLRENAGAAGVVLSPEEVETIDKDLNIAAITVAVSDLSAEARSAIAVAEIGDSSALKVSNQVVAIGNALGYGQSVTAGIVSAVDRSITTGTDSSGQPITSTYLQTDAAINPGNSGGALLNMDGELVGINTAKVSSEEVEGMGYAIPIQEAWDVISSMIPASAFSSGTAV